MTNETFSIVTDLIKSRRSIFPKSYIEKEIPDYLIKQILDNGNWAPNHKKTEPWRFKIFKGESLRTLGEYLANYLEKNKDDVPQSKLDRTKKKPVQSACVVAIILHKDLEERLPEWEELAATACAVQNIWLSCTALGIGSYWSSPSAIINAHKFLNLKDNEQCLGLFYMGYYDNSIEFQSERGAIEEKIEWI
jgi:nitroreductase